MRLADRIAQCRTPFIVQNTKDGSITHLANAAAFAQDINNCATRYVLNDELTRLCSALAYFVPAGGSCVKNAAGTRLVRPFGSSLRSVE
jgi:hypothetical protein